MKITLNPQTGFCEITEAQRACIASFEVCDDETFSSKVVAVQVWEFEEQVSALRVAPRA